MSSWWKLAVGFTFLAAATVVHAVVLIVLLPSRNARIRSCNYWGWVVGRVCLAISGCGLTIRGAEHLAGERPVIFVSNHTSIIDILLGIWQAPVGTVGVAKKEIVWFPFFGQLYALSGHLRVDRGDHARAVEAMADLERIVEQHRLSIWMWPEGTRSQDGRLRPFKKGLYHLAVGTGLPIVPVIVSGAHRSWEKGSRRVVGVPVEVVALPPIDTSGWASRSAEDCLAEVHGLFVAQLPADQRPVPAAA